MSEPVTCIQKQPPTHTPGPWRAKIGKTQMVDDGTTVARIQLRRDGYSWWIFSDADCHGDAKATAALIAKAPDLLAFAERTLPQLIAERDCYYEGCTNHLGEYDDGIEGDEDRETVQQFDREIDALRDLIAAAKGEQA